MLDCTESTTPRSDDSSDRNELGAGTARTAPGVTSGAARTRSDTAAASGRAARRGFVGSLLEDDVHVIGGPLRDRCDARVDGSAVAALEIELIGDVFVDVPGRGFEGSPPFVNPCTGA
jgi:hypothetical protein